MTAIAAGGWPELSAKIVARSPAGGGAMPLALLLFLLPASLLLLLLVVVLLLLKPRAAAREAAGPAGDWTAQRGPGPSGGWCRPARARKGRCRAEEIPGRRKRPTEAGEGRVGGSNVVTGGKLEDFV